jgi:hypothetical protein
MKDFWHHLFLPHHTNNHRAKVLHIDALFIYLLFFALFNISVHSIHKAAPQVLGYATDIYSDQLLTGTNNVRKSAGLAPLTLNPQLTQAASAKAQYMFTKNFWAHVAPDGKTPWEFITATGYKYTVAGENLAKNFNDSQGVVDAWMASPSHRDNLLKSSYRDVGFAVANGVLNGEETTLVVQMFGSTESLVTQKPPALPQDAAKTVVNPVPVAQIPANQPNVQPIKVAAELPPQVINPAPAGSAVVGAFSGVTLKPIIDLNVFTRSIAYSFIGIMLVLFVVDAYVVARRKYIRVTGHSLAHILFLLSITIALTLTVPGAIL